MAKKQNQESTPALIDYAGASAANESASQGNAFADCKRYWKRALLDKHNVGGLIWGIKDQTNLSRLIKEFEDTERIKAMMNEWITGKEIGYATQFGLFYKNRYVLHQRTQPKDYDW